MSVCLFIGVLVLRKHSSEFSRMWGRDPLTKRQLESWDADGSATACTPYSNSLQPAACTFLVLLQLQMPFNTPQPRKRRQRSGKASALPHHPSRLEEDFHKDHPSRWCSGARSCNDHDRRQPSPLPPELVLLHPHPFQAFSKYSP